MMLDRNHIYLGDCLIVMQEIPENIVDAIVTDPPYGLKFMGKEWDHGIPGIPFWQEALRVCKPGAHMLAFGGTRTHHRLMVAIEDAGWEIRDTLGWIYGSGFPKSMNVSKAIDKAAGVEREVVGMSKHKSGIADGNSGAQCRENDHAWASGKSVAVHVPITIPSTDAAKQWNGWGTALKPAWEPIILARKPLDGTVAQNVLKWGVGGINIDGCRVTIDPKIDDPRLGGKGEWHIKREQSNHTVSLPPKTMGSSEKGRFPANLIHDGSDEVLTFFPITTSGATKRNIASYAGESVTGFLRGESNPKNQHGDSGSAARFFYCAKASKSERNLGLSEGTINQHPTVKPIALLEYLCKLITPLGGLVLDPFVGSGSTCIACKKLGLDYIGIEKESVYITIAEKRLEKVNNRKITDFFES